MTDQAPPEVSSRNYDAVAGFYERVAGLYSFGLIAKAKLAELDYMQPGARVLYLGVGTGEDALAAARKSVKVTAIDLSPRMIGRLRRRFEEAGLSGELIVGDVMEHEPAEPYDAVCGNYFFNVFPASDLDAVLGKAAGLVKPGGRLMVADMAPQKGALAPLGWAYLKLGLSVFWALRLASQHPIYDFAEIGARHGLETEAVHDFGPRALPLYRTVVLRRERE